MICKEFYIDINLIIPGFWNWSSFQSKAGRWFVFKVAGDISAYSSSSILTKYFPASRRWQITYIRLNYNSPYQTLNSAYLNRKTVLRQKDLNCIGVLILEHWRNLKPWKTKLAFSGTEYKYTVNNIISWTLLAVVSS